jgi:LysR family transcriptional regulator (chromosome initiation inhibitor)
MSPYPHHEEPAKEAVITLIGIGNAGVNITDRLAMRAALPIRTIALNSDQQSLTASVASKKLVLGPMTTHGLGAGGDPERAIDAAKESLGELQEAVSGSDVVILCAGLGGGTGSAVTPLLAKMAKEKGALVVGVVTSPFQFEGRRRSQQAAESLAELARHVDALIHFENDRMAELVEPRADVSETFAACDGLLFQAIGGIVRMLGNPGPLPIAVNADSLATWLAPALARFAATAPVLLDVAVDDQDHTADWLRSGAVLAAVTGTARPATGANSSPIGAMRYVAVASPAFIARHFADGVVGAASLAQAPSLVFNTKDDLQARWVRRQCHRHVELPRHTLPSPQAFVTAGVAGMGWGMHPQALVTQELHQGTLVELVPSTPLDVPLYWQQARSASRLLEGLTRGVHEAARAALIASPRA